MNEDVSSVENEDFPMSSAEKQKIAGPKTFGSNSTSRKQG